MLECLGSGDMDRAEGKQRSGACLLFFCIISHWSEFEFFLNLFLAFSEGRGGRKQGIFGEIPVGMFSLGCIEWQVKEGTSEYFGTLYLVSLVLSVETCLGHCNRLDIM